MKIARTIATLLLILTTTSVYSQESDERVNSSREQLLEAAEKIIKSSESNPTKLHATTEALQLFRKAQEISTSESYGLSASGSSLLIAAKSVRVSNVEGMTIEARLLMAKANALHEAYSTNNDTLAALSRKQESTLSK